MNNEISPEIMAIFEKADRQEKVRLILNNRGIDREKVVIYSYAELRDYLNTLSEGELKQQVQILGDKGSLNEDSHLEPVVGAGTVEKMCHVDGEAVTQTRSAQDFQHHPEQVILVRDGSPFGKDGDSAYEMVKDGFIGNVSGKFFPFIEKKPHEPSMNASYSPAMQPKMGDSSEELQAKFETLCQRSFDLQGQPESTANDAGLIPLMAELYRRLFHLDPQYRIE